MFFSGARVDGAFPDSGGKVGALVGIVSEKSCADECLEGAIDERRVESVAIEFIVELRRGGKICYRPAVSGSDIGDALECVTVCEPDRVGAGVELLTVDRGDRLCAARCVGAVRRRGEGIEFCGRGDRPLHVTTGRRGEGGEFQGARFSVERGSEHGIAGVIEDECPSKRQIVDAVVN